ncbi:MAG: Sporulation kinase E [Pelotomaculum sp. PtaB.Bin104]|nr:MAG: Sporulation kinase E [Pelotomaculum sp. PtaB.Bin104]
MLNEELLCKTSQKLLDMIEEEIKKHRDHLEELVKVRTIELEIAKEQLQQEINERRKLEESLKENEERYRQLVDLSPDAVVIHSEGKIEFINEAGARLVGAPSTGEIIGKSILDFAHPDFKKVIQERWKQIKDTGTALSFIEGKLIHFNGEVIDIESAVTPITFQGKSAMQAVMRDISERKRTEKALKDSNERLITVLDSLDAAVYVADMENYEVLYTNQYMRDKFGVVEGDTCWQKIQENQSGPCVFCTNNKLISSNGEPTGLYNWDFRNTRNGIWVHCRDRAIRWIDGRMVKLEIATNITSRKNVEEALKNERQRLFSLLDKLPAYVCLIAPDYSFRFTNSYFRERFGETDGKTCYEVFRGRNTPCKKCPIFSVFDTQVPQERDWTSLSGATYQMYDYPFKDFDGSPLVLELGIDITERKQSEKVINELKEQYQRLVNEALVGVYIFQDGSLCFVNPKFAEIFGYTVDELNKINPVELVSPDDLAMVRKLFRQGLDGEVNSIKFNLRGLKKDGSVIYIDVYSLKSSFQGRPAIQGMLQDVTEQKHALETLRLSEERFSKAFNAGPNPMAITTIESGQIIDINNNFLSFFGYSRQEVLYRTAKAFKALNLYEHPEDRAKIIESVMEKGFVKNLDINFRIKSGEIKIGLFSSDIIVIGSEKYLLSVISDITELKQVEKKLRLSEERFYKAFYNNPIPMVIVRQGNDQHIEVNKSYERYFGFNREEIIGRTVLDMGLFAESEKFKLYRKIVTEQGYVHNFGVIFKTKFNDSRNVLMSAEIIELNNEECRLITLNDITDLKKIENEIARLERMNLIGQMAAGIGHEIRNPMTTVRGFLQIYRKKDSFVEYKDSFDLMIDELDRANSIITEFLSLARNKPVDLKRQNINQILQKLFPLIQADAFDNDKFIELELTETVDLLLDEKEIIQLILNLVRNGLEAMTAGRTLTIRTFLEDNQVVLAVEDQGSGIKPEALDQIGTPFFTTKENGTGLGLSVCYSIVERHNATINIETGSSGTTVFVRFEQ